MEYPIKNHSRRGFLAWATLSGGLVMTGAAGLRVLAADAQPTVRAAAKSAKTLQSAAKKARGESSAEGQGSEESAPTAKAASHQVLKIQSGKSRVGRVKRPLLDARLLDPRIADVKLLNGGDFKLTGGMPGRTTLTLTQGDANHQDTITFDVVVESPPETITETEPTVARPDPIHTVSHQSASGPRPARSTTYSVRGPHGFTH